MGDLTFESIRGTITTEEIALTARYVADRRCQCCGSLLNDLEEMFCGHFWCFLCREHDHTCIACALSV